MTLLSFCVTVAFANLSVGQIENMVHKIHLKREGIGLDKLEQTKEPFVRIVEEENTTVVQLPDPTKKEDVRFSLHAIMANKAYINDGWKKVDDVILGYTLKYVGKRGVVLQNGNTIKKVFLGKPKEQLITFEERE